MTSPLSLPLPTEQYLADRCWIQEHIGMLVRKHPNQWIAVHGGEVLASGADLGQVADQAERSTTDTDVVFQFIDDGTLIF